MACRLAGAKPLSAPMLEYCQLDPWEQISAKPQSKFIHFQSRNVVSKITLLISWSHLPWDNESNPCCLAVGVALPCLLCLFCLTWIQGGGHNSQHCCGTGYNKQFIRCYRKTSSISRTKSQSLNVSCSLLQVSSLNPLKPGVKLIMKM